MSEKFKKRQLVAVRDNADGRWSLWIYDHASPEGLHFCRSPNHTIGPRWWRYAVPAEEVWSNIFLGWERCAGEQAAESVAMESELVQRLRRQIEWLCQELAHADMCPSVSAIASCDKDCPSCWEQASLKAVEDVKNE
jgi:hypothetical protein